MADGTEFFGVYNRESEDVVVFNLYKK